MRYSVQQCRFQLVGSAQDLPLGSFTAQFRALDGKAELDADRFQNPMLAPAQRLRINPPKDGERANRYAVGGHFDLVDEARRFPIAFTRRRRWARVNPPSRRPILNAPGLARRVQADPTRVIPLL